MAVKEKLSREDKFMSFVRKTPACWLWTGSLRGKPGNAYGKFYYHGKTISAHRYALEQSLGYPLDPLKDVMHTCDNGLCVNPEHLSLGTHTDNMKDKMGKGRGNHLKGGAHPNSKLDEVQVRCIKVMLGQGVPQRKIAAMFGVVHGVIGFISTGKQWKHVKI